MAGQRAEPGLDRVQRLGNAGEVAALDQLLRCLEVGLGPARVFVPDRERRGDERRTNLIGAEFLQGGVGVGGLVGGVAVEEHARLAGHDLLQDRGDRLALGEPLPADAGEKPLRVGAVETDRPGRPAVFEGEPVEIVEQPRPGRGRKADDRERAQMRGAEPGRQAADEGAVRQQCVEVHRRLGHPHPLPVPRDGRMQIREGLGVVEPGRLGHQAGEQIEDAIGAGDEAGEMRARIGAGRRRTLVEPAHGAARLVGRRHPDQRQEIPPLEMARGLLELGAPLGVDQRGHRIGEARARIGARRDPLGFDEDRPARAEPAQRVVEPAGGGDQLGRGRRVEVGTAEPRGALQARVLVEHDAGRDQRRPGQEVREVRGLGAVFGEAHHAGSRHEIMIGPEHRTPLLRIMPFRPRTRSGSAGGGARHR